MLQADIQLLFRVEYVAHGDLPPEDFEMIDADVDVDADVSMEVVKRQGAKRRDSVTESVLDLMRNVSRLYKVSAGKLGEMVVSSHGYEQV